MKEGTIYGIKEATGRRGRRVKRYKFALRELENTGNLKKMYWIALS
jgi:hypothetical protein